MSNFFDDLWRTAVGIGKMPFADARFIGDVVTGDVSLKDAPGVHQDLSHKYLTEPLLGDSKLAKNSDAVAGAIVGGILAAPLVAGAAGGSAGGAAGAAGSAGGSTGAMSSSFSLGNIGSYFNPSEWFGGGISDEALGALADAENAAGGAVNADLGLGSDALKSLGYGGDTAQMFSELGKTLQSIKTPEEYKVQHSGGVNGRGFNFNSEQYKNKLMEREMAAIYNQPIYRSPTGSSK